MPVAAKSSAMVAKPGILDRLKQMLPSKKKPGSCVIRVSCGVVKIGDKSGCKGGWLR